MELEFSLKADECSQIKVQLESYRSLMNALEAELKKNQEALASVKTSVADISKHGGSLRAVKFHVLLPFNYKLLLMPCCLVQCQNKRKSCKGPSFAKSAS